MKFWEKLQPDQLEDNKPTPWWCWPLVGLGFMIGFVAVVLVVLLVFLALGFCASLLWNYAVAPIFNISELTTYTAAALLFLIYATIRIVKWAID